MLQCIVVSELSLRSLLLKEIRKVTTGELTAAIRMKSFYLRAVLSLCLGREHLVGSESLVLCP